MGKQQQGQLILKLTNDNIHLNTDIVNNDDLNRVPLFKANFSKAFPHHPKIISKDSTEYIVSEKEYPKLLDGIFNRNPQSISSIKLGTPDGLKLVNPSNVFDLELVSVYKATLSVPPAPLFWSKTAAGEMVELYEMALLRDIPFSEWNTNQEVLRACENISSLKSFYGPKVNNTVTSQTLFRNGFPGCLDGGYVSLFLTLDVPFGPMLIEQKYNSPAVNDDYLYSVDDYLSVWSGKIPKPQSQPSERRKIQTLRDGAYYVHYDEPGQAFVNALRVLYNKNMPLDPGTNIPKNDDLFVSIGIMDIEYVLNVSFKLALDAAWMSKWTQLRLRPEEFGYQIQLAKEGKDNKISKEVLDNSVLDKVKEKYGSYLLSQAYAEGCPTHPAYPAGHATLSGAGATILKAFFNAKKELSDGLTVEGELNKLASNIALFRDAAGVHYRSDAIGIQLGERVAVYLLQEMVNRYHQKVVLTLPLFNGDEIKISNVNC